MTVLKLVGSALPGPNVTSDPQIDLNVTVVMMSVQR